MKEEKMQWKAYEYPYRKKSSDWFWAVGIIAFSAAMTAVIFNNIIFAIFIVLSAFTLSLYAARKPSIVNIELNSKGVIVGNHIYLYSTVEKFWVAEKNTGAVIILKSQKPILPYVTIPVGETEPEEIREYLSRHLEEKEMAEPLVQSVMEYLGF